MKLLRGMGSAAAICAAGLLLVWAIFLLRAEVSWRRAESLMAAGDTAAAGSSARGVFDLYVPGNPRLGDASRLIWTAAREHEAKGDVAAALAAYRELRSAWIGAAPIEGDEGWITRCEERIALLAQPNVEDGQVTDDDLARPGEQGALAPMSPPRRPHGGWGVVGALSFAVWICAAVGLIVGGLRRDGRPRLAALGWAGVLVVGYAAWILGLMRA